MSLESIIDLGGVFGISYTAINDCKGIWLRVCEENNRVIISRKKESEI